MSADNALLVQLRGILTRRRNIAEHHRRVQWGSCVVSTIISTERILKRFATAGNVDENPMLFSKKEKDEEYREPLKTSEEKK